MGSVVGEVVEIDGSIMEGGGQILRMSVCYPASAPALLTKIFLRSASLLFFINQFGSVG